MAARVRDLALEALRRVETQGAFASAVLRATLDANPDLDERDRALFTELLYGVLRHRGHLDRALSRLGKRLKDLDPKIHDVLRLAAYQLLFLDRVPEHAAVSDAVDQAKKRSGERGAGQVNAILRKLSAIPRADRLPAPAPFDADPARHVAEAASLPRLIADTLVRDLGPDAALAFARASLERAPLTLRANALVVDRDTLAREVGGEPGTHPLSVRLPGRFGLLPADLPAVVEGRATPQDEGSMAVVDLLDPQPGERILDLCAAPGGKTTHAAERMGDRGEVIACDRTPAKLAQVDSNARRLHLQSVHTAEVYPPDEPTFDRVLVDAPCSGLGTLRRHPELRWRIRADDLPRLAAIQEELLLEGARRVKPGGSLVYSVCTVTRAEGEAQIATLPNFELIRSFRIGPHEKGAPDGFFAALLRRIKADEN